jgi:hypothetical protein
MKVSAETEAALQRIGRATDTDYQIIKELDVCHKTIAEAVAAEREACLQIADDYEEMNCVAFEKKYGFVEGENVTVAAAIRKRGEE